MLKHHTDLTDVEHCLFTYLFNLYDAPDEVKQDRFEAFMAISPEVCLGIVDRRWHELSVESRLAVACYQADMELPDELA